MIVPHFEGLALGAEQRDLSEPSLIFFGDA
jgi:hypothetical protein